MWTGDCKVVMEGSSTCKIQFVNQDGTIFAASVIKEEYYEKYI